MKEHQLPTERARNKNSLSLSPLLLLHKSFISCNAVEAYRGYKSKTPRTALVGGERSASYSCRFTPGEKEHPISISHEGVWMDANVHRDAVVMRKIPAPPEIETRTSDS
jgi:hypothetical protein